MNFKKNRYNCKKHISKVVLVQTFIGIVAAEFL